MVLNLDSVFVDTISGQTDTADDAAKTAFHAPLRIAVAGSGYVGLSIATLLSQHNHVTAVDIVPEKVDLINQRKSPIQERIY